MEGRCLAALVATSVDNSLRHLSQCSSEGRTAYVGGSIMSDLISRTLESLDPSTRLSSRIDSTLWRYHLHQLVGVPALPYYSSSSSPPQPFREPPPGITGVHRRGRVVPEIAAGRAQSSPSSIVFYQVSSSLFFLILLEMSVRKMDNPSGERVAVLREKEKVREITEYKQSTNYN